MEFVCECVADGEVALLEQVVDHALEAHAAAVVGVVNAVDAISLEFFNFGGQDGAAAAAEEFDVARAAFAQQVVHVFEKLRVAALVGRDGDALHVFLNGAVDNLLHAAVVSEVDDLGAGGLQDAAHDVDGGIVSVEQAGGGDEADFMDGLVRRLLLHGVVVRQAIGCAHKGKADRLICYISSGRCAQPRMWPSLVCMCCVPAYKR